MAITTLQKVKAQAGIDQSNTAYDGQINSLIAGVTALVKSYLRRDLEEAEYTEFYSGDNYPVLLLREYPVTAVSLVCIDNNGYFGVGPNGFDTSLNLVEGSDFAIMDGAKGSGSSGKLLRIGGVWQGLPTRYVGWLANQPPKPTGNIKVVYTAGYTEETMPADIVMAVNSAIFKQVITSGLGGELTSANYEDAGASFQSPEAALQTFGSITGVLSNYIEPVV